MTLKEKVQIQFDMIDQKLKSWQILDNDDYVHDPNLAC